MGRITTIKGLGPGYLLEHDHDAFSKQVLSSPKMRAEMLRRATLGATYARSIAPVATGAYVESIEADVYLRHGETDFDDGHYGRAVGRVSAGTDHAVYVEFGDGVHPGQRVLGRCLPIMKAG